MPDREGVEIYKRFYPWPDSFRLGDPVLVKEITGMRWPDFVQALDDQNQAIEEAQEMGTQLPQPDQVVLAGLIAVAFWQGNSTMTRDKVRRALERIPMEDIEVVDGDEGDAELVPLAAGGEGAANTTASSNGSGDSPELRMVTPPLDFTSDETSQSDSGLPGSLTTSPA